MSPWDLVFKHRYNEAVSIYEQQLSDKTNDNNWFAEMGTALLSAGRLNEALLAFQRAQSISSAKGADSEGDYLEEIATTFWLMGEKVKARDTLYRAVNGISRGKFKYADSSGGAGAGLLLWYVGVTMSDSEAERHARTFLKDLSDRPRIQYYPGPIALYILDKCSFCELLTEAAGVAELSEAIVGARKDLLVRRQLCQALFYDSVLARTKGDEQGCLEQLHRCHSLENPILENEWYLARWELNVLK
jgi:tetratricopeptide (TPR) repeat protein